MSKIRSLDFGNTFDIAMDLGSFLDIHRGLLDTTTGVAVQMPVFLTVSASIDKNARIRPRNYLGTDVDLHHYQYYNLKMNMMTETTSSLRDLALKYRRCYFSDERKLEFFEAYSG